MTPGWLYSKKRSLLCEKTKVGKEWCRVHEGRGLLQSDKLCFPDGTTGHGLIIHTVIYFGGFFFFVAT